jgi:hypothetical protein
MQYDANSFQDIAFILPFGSTMESLTETLVYCDDLDLLTNMFWWFVTCLASMSLH